MEENKRVYPRSAFQGKWLNYLLLFLSATLLLSGLLWRGSNDDVQIGVADTPTPIPTSDIFDETMESRELTLPSCTWYALQLGAFENEDSALQLAEQYQSRGAAGYVWKDTRYRALAALYQTQEEARIVRARLSEKQYIDTYTFEITLPALTLRIRGMKGQLDILEAAFLHGHDLISQLQALSILMDQQELSVAEAITNLQAIGEQMENVSLRLNQRFTAPRHASVQGLIDCFEQYEAFCRKVDDKQTSVQLATEIKYQTLGALHALKEIYDALGNT